MSLTMLPLLLILTGLLMVAPLYLPKLMQRRNGLVNGFQIVNVFIGYLCGFGMVFPEYLFGLLVIYGVFGFSKGLLARQQIEATATEA